MKMRILFIPALLLASVAGYAQKPYTTSSGELIFSYANIKYKGNETSSKLRFSPVFNIQTLVNFDRSDKFGIITGLAVRNVGFIYDVPDQPGVRMKHRTYNLGIPIGVKIGNLDKVFIFGGYELEIPFVYKEKTFVNEDKEDKSTIWFSNRVNTFNNTVFLGVQLPKGLSVKFKYYLTNFFNKDFESTTNGVTSKPYADSNYNIFYFSLTTNLFRGTDFEYSK
jgi:hypothetical protein